MLGGARDARYIFFNQILFPLRLVCTHNSDSSLRQIFALTIIKIKFHLITKANKIGYN